MFFLGCLKTVVHIKFRTCDFDVKSPFVDGGECSRYIKGKLSRGSAQ